MNTIWVKTSKNKNLYSFEEYTLLDDGKVVGKVQEIFTGEYTSMADPCGAIFKWQGWFQTGELGVFPTHNYDTAEDVKVVVETGYNWGHTLDFWAINEWEKEVWGEYFIGDNNVHN